VNGSGSPPAIELVGIDKSFGPVVANRGVHLAVARGSIHGLVGENGAGKSTLMTILYGVYQADTGEIRRNGATVRIASTRDAIALGIGMVHQHFMLVEPLTVLENIMLGAETSLWLGRARRRARARLARLAEDYGLALDLDCPVAALSLGERQRAEILRALYREADLLILDEPTAVLTPQESARLFRILGALKAQGKAVILISHRLREVLSVTDAITVMRQGQVVARLVTAETDEARLAELMVGRKVALSLERELAAPGAPLLEIDRLTLIDPLGIARLHDISFTLHRGEILAVAGISGNGQTELMQALAGLRPVASGSVRLRGEELMARGRLPSPRRMRALGLGHAPEDRDGMGLVAAFPAFESTLLGRQRDADLGRGPWLDQRQLLAFCRRCLDSFAVRPADPLRATGLLSGGNRQKLVLARELAGDPDLLLVGQPSRGVDIGAIEFIHRRLLALRQSGKAILLVSADLDEVLALADRILVMAGGRIAGTIPRAEADERRLGLMMAGIAA
jgi:ABC-type uncharacterized transport system ATPase subunit